MRSVRDLLDALARAGVTLSAEGGSLRVRGPVGVVDAALREELAARKSDILSHLERTGDAHPSPAPAQDVTQGAQRVPARRDPEAPAPLTYNQRRLWFLDRLGENGSEFTMTAAWSLQGPLDVAAFNRAVGALTRRHAVLRARIAAGSEDADPQLCISPWEVSAIDAEPAGGAEADTLVTAAAGRPFDLEAGPLFRMHLFRMDAERHLLVLCLHHVIADRWSMGLLFRDLSAFMTAEVTGTAPDLPALPIQFPDFAAWQRARLDPQSLGELVDFWKNRLAGAPSDLTLPLDRKRSATRGPRGDAVRFRLGRGDGLTGVAAEHGATPFMAYLTAYAALLARWSGQEEVVVGCPLGSRERPETYDLIGFFVNTVALRLDLSDDPDFATLLQRARSVSLEALEHQDAPFDRVVDALKPERELNRNPLFQAMFVLQNAEMAGLGWPGVTARPLEVPVMAPEVDFSLALEADPDGGGFDGYLEFDPEIFARSTAERFVRQFEALCRAVAAAPETPLSRLPITPDEAAVWRGPETARPAARVDSLIASRLRENPSRAAVVAPDGSVVTAGDLLERVDALAARLVEEGVGPGSIVGLCLPRGVALVQSMLAVWRTGGAFAVLAPDAPSAHLARIAAACRMRVAVTDAGSAPLLPDGIRAVAPRAEDAPTPAKPLPDPEAASDDLAYVCFTSGSTGTPKGVSVGHAALLNHARSIVEAFALGSEDRVLQFAAPGFDVALEEILPTLLAGAVVVPAVQDAADSIEGFERAIAENSVTVVNLPAPFWHAWVGDLSDRDMPPPPGLRLVVTGSDRVQVRKLREWQRLAPAVPVLSGYGPTEATVTAMLFDPARDPVPECLETLPLGRPLPNVGVSLRDGAGNPVPVGVVGEIVLDGAGLASGYLETPADTGFRLLPDGRPAYWTGDLGRMRPDGSLEFLGRRDAQVKLRGIRVEPAEVEALIAACPAVEVAAVIARTDANGATLLEAYVVGNVADLRSWMPEAMPKHLIPGVIHQIDRLPTTASGKIDRRALSEGMAAFEGPRPARDFADEAERDIASLFEEVLKCGRVGPDDNFFELGGDSITSLQIVARARRRGIGLTARLVFQHQTVAAIARAAAMPADDNTRAPGHGDVPPTPILAWFHETVTEDWHHFNQAVVIAVPQPVNAVALEAALAAVVECHEALGIVVDDSVRPVRYRIPADPAPPKLTRLDLSGLSEAERRSQRDACFAQVQASLDPRQGRNIAAVLLPDEGRMLLTIHHLCVDVLSWGVLLDDLELAYDAAVAGRSARLRRSGTPYRVWAERLHAAAHDTDATGDLPYWLGLLAHPADRLLAAAGDDPGTEATTAVARRMLEVPLTTDILRTAPAAFGCRADEAVIAALLLTLHRRGGNRLRLDLERNGRVSPFGDLDLSRTVGWFTSLVPLLLEADESDPAALIQQVARAVADSPMDGLGYGLLRYLSDAPGRKALEALPAAEILLNFVGSLSGWNEAGFRPVDDDCGPTIAPGIRRTHPLELNAGAVEGRLRLELSYPTAAGCAAAAEALMDDIVAALADIGRAARIARAGIDLPPGIEEILPLTPLQQGIFFHSLRVPETYFDQLRLTLDGPLDAESLHAAWCTVVARHKALRATFHSAGDGEPVQLIHGGAVPGWRETDWRDVGLDAAEHRIEALMAADRAVGFDVARGPLLRLHLVRTGETRHDLIWSSHHLIMDGWSVSQIMAEIVALYRDGVAAVLPPAPDFAGYFGWLHSADRTADQAYWAEALSGLEATRLVGPGLSSAGEERADGPASACATLDAGEAAAIEALARAGGVTLGTAIQGAWALLLSRYVDSEDVAFGLTVSGRPPELSGMETMVGMLINTLPVRVRVEGGARVIDWLARLGAQAAERQAHAAMPLPATLAAAGLPELPLPFDTLVLVQNYPRPDSLEAGGVAISLTEVREATDFPVTLVAEWGRAPRLTIVHDAARVSPAAAAQLLQHLRTLLGAMASDPAARLDDLGLYDPAALQDRIALGRGAKLDVPSPLAHEIVAEWAALIPDAPAVLSSGGSLTYGALNMRAAAFAARIAGAGVRPGERVAFAVPRSAEAVVVILAILKVGGVFVPLDPAYPRERLDDMLADCEAALLVTDAAHRDRFAALGDGKGPPVLLLDDAADEAAAETGWIPPTLSDEAPCYLIYTSGSTGRPKGVLNQHRGLRSLIHVQRAVFGLGPGDRALQFASLSFDASVWEIFMALGAGAALYVPGRDEALAGPELAAYMRQNRIGIATIPPSLLAALPEGNYPDLRMLMVAGEACPPDLAWRWSRGRRFFNGYGPSEASVCATIHNGGGDGTLLPIGRAIANMSAHVLDSRLRPVPPGGEGELVIGGVGVALGYLNRPELTTERFVPDVFSDVPGARLYRTGDRVRLTLDGEIHFLGRIDRQVKLRGFRIEPGEVEAVLTAQPGVARALVGLRADARGEERLLAWVLAADGKTADPAAIRRALQDALPGHLVPAAIVRIATVPLTPNGKVDWAALPGPDENRPADAMPARGAAETSDASTGRTLAEQLAALWAGLLDRAVVGVDENFFDIGGHSLLLVRMQPMLEEAFGVTLKASELFAHPTVRLLARRLEAEGAVAARASEPVETEGISSEVGVEPAAAPTVDTAEPIAVIGMAGRFPGAPDVEAFWRLLAEGREGLSRLSREELAAAGAEPGREADPMFVPAGGVLADAEAFDPAVFGLGPRDALVLDPQHRVFLECAWHALEDAGYAPKGSARDRSGMAIGLFAGCGYNSWLNRVLVPSGEEVSGSAGYHLVASNDKDFLATQAAFRLDLKGPVMSVQTACSSSLVAVAMAVEALRSAQCQMALAGGVSIQFPQGQGYRYEPDMILSPDGHCRPFSADAAGTVPGAGSGLVLLKPLSRAQSDGDRILAVIRGAAVTNDGSAKMGFTAPGVDGQAAAIQVALESAGLGTDDVDYVEAHGTGTALGDPVEVTALSRVFSGRREPLLLGSVKSNIGHADSAAGIAGLMKAVLALDRKLLPASLHANPPNPRIDFSAGPFEVVAAARSWPERDRPLRAGVSSFGIGGTNAHVVLESAPADHTSATDGANRDEAILLSAQTATALARAAANLSAHLRAQPDIALGDVAYTLQCGRAGLPHRRAVVARDAHAAAQALETPGVGVAGEAGLQPPAVALLLPGQGSQHPRMGQELYVAGGVFRRELDAMSAILEPMIGRSLAGFLYGGTAAPEELSETRIAQPAVFAVSVALARQWQAFGLEWEGMLGHSVGEYAAAHLAGVFNVEDALAILVERGRLIGSLPRGAMLAVSTGERETQALIDDSPFDGALSLAAINGANQCVVSGSHDAVGKLEERLQSAGRPGRRLHTSHAFHSPMLGPAAERLADFIARRRPRPPVARFVSNVTGTWIVPTDATDPAYWARHMLAPVRFADGVACLREAGIDLAVECGPGQTLSPMASAGGLKAFPSLAHAAETVSGGTRMAAASAGLWVAGYELDWTAMHSGRPRRVSLPLYPFERRPYRPISKDAMSGTPALPAKRPSPDSWFYRPVWVPAASGPGIPIDDPVLVLADEGGVGAALAARLAEAGSTAYRAVAGDRFARGSDGVYSVRPSDCEDYRRLFDALPATPRRIIHLWGLDAGGPQALEERGLFAVLALAQAIGRDLSGQPLRLDLATVGAADVTGMEELRPELAAAVGALRILPYEYPDLTVNAMDLEALPGERLAERLFAELHVDPTSTVTAVRGEARWQPSVVPIALPDTAACRLDGAVVLITGAFGGVGRALARDLARETGVRLVLCGHQPMDEDRQGFVRDLEAGGAEVMAVSVDVSDGDAVAAVAGEAIHRFGRITGVIHAAGLADHGGVVQNRGRAETERVLAPKIAGTRALEQALAGQPLEFFALCSTLGSFLPAAKFGQVAYAAANEYLDLAAATIARRTGWNAVAVNWDDWVEAGMTVAAHRAWGTPALQEEDGLTAAEGATALRRIIAGRKTRVAVSVRDLPALIAKSHEHFAPAMAAPRRAAARDVPATGFVPQNDDDPLESRLTFLFRSILDDAGLGPEDDFFARGGHSLLAMRLLAQLRDAYAVPVGIADIFDCPTPRALAARIRPHVPAPATPAEGAAE